MSPTDTCVSDGRIDPDSQTRTALGKLGVLTLESCATVDLTTSSLSGDDSPDPIEELPIVDVTLEAPVPEKFGHDGTVEIALLSIRPRYDHVDPMTRPVALPTGDPVESYEGYDIDVSLYTYPESTGLPTVSNFDWHDHNLTYYGPNDPGNRQLFAASTDDLAGAVEIIHNVATTLIDRLDE
jgi:hypothetical protein